MNVDFYLTILLILGPFTVGVLKKREKLSKKIYISFYKKQLHKTNLSEFFLIFYIKIIHVVVIIYVMCTFMCI